jgi:hypothetical protein
VLDCDAEALLNKIFFAAKIDQKFAGLGQHIQTDNGVDTFRDIRRLIIDDELRFRREEVEESESMTVPCRCKLLPSACAAPTSRSSREYGWPRPRKQRLRLEYKNQNGNPAPRKCCCALRVGV